MWNSSTLRKCDLRKQLLLFYCEIAEFVISYLKYNFLFFGFAFVRFAFRYMWFIFRKSPNRNANKSKWPFLVQIMQPKGGCDMR